MSKQKSQPEHYWCFISYQHGDNETKGRRWANWLHKQIEEYEIPPRLINTTNQYNEKIPSKISPVFIDQQELEAGGKLKERINIALDNSATLVVLCSSRSKESPYVNQEIAYYRKIGKGNRIYPALLEGEGTTNYPEALTEKGRDGESLDSLAVSFRLSDDTQGWTDPKEYKIHLKSQAKPYKSIKKELDDYSELLEHSKLKLIAGIIGIKLDELIQRDIAKTARKLKRQRIILFTFIAITILALIGITLTVKKNQEVISQRDLAHINEGQSWLLQSEVAEQNGNRYPDKILYAAKAIGFDGLGRETKSEPTFQDRIAEWIPQLSKPDPNLRLWKSWSHKSKYEQAVETIKSSPFYAPVWISDKTDLDPRILDVSPTGRHMASASKSGSIYLWDFNSKDEILTNLPIEAERVNNVLFDPYRPVLSIATDRGTITYDLEKQSVINRNNDQIELVSHSLLGETKAASTYNGSVELLKSDQRVTLESSKHSVNREGDYPSVKNELQKIEYSQDGSFILNLYSNGNITMILADYDSLHHAWEDDSIPLASTFALNPDNSLVAIGKDDGSIALLGANSARTLTKTANESNHGSKVLDLHFRSDGEMIASGSEDGEIRIWGLSKDRENVVISLIATLCGCEGQVKRVLFIPGRKLLVSVSSDGRARIWNICHNTFSDYNLYDYIAKNWYTFNQSNQVVWSKGEGFLNLPKRSTIQLWRNGGSKVSEHLLQTENLSGALIVSSKSNRSRISDLLIHSGKDSIDDRQFYRARLFAHQLDHIGEKKAANSLLEKIDDFCQEGSNFENGEGIEMIWCPKGSFQMGDGKENQAKRHINLTQGFWISRFEISQETYETIAGDNPSTNKGDAQRPVENVSWYDALNFCNILSDREKVRGTLLSGWSYSLPTEAQWEYACRAGTPSSYKYSFGDADSDLKNYGNFDDGHFQRNYEEAWGKDRQRYTSAVNGNAFIDDKLVEGYFKPNPWGIYHMHGNVLEWCFDSHDKDDRQYQLDDLTDPLVRKGDFRINRGGSYSTSANSCASATRDYAWPEFEYNRLGIRLVLVRSDQRE